MLIKNLLPLHGCQATQLKREDRVSLNLINLKQRHQTLTRLLHCGATTNEGDDFVKKVECFQVGLKNMQALPSLRQSELRAAHDDVNLVLDPVVDKAINRQGPWHPVNQRQHVGGEGLLKGSPLIEVVEDNSWNRIPLEHNDQPLTIVSRGLITNVRNSLDLTAARQIGNLGGQRVRIDLIWQRLDDQAGAVVDLFNIDNGALNNGAASSSICVLNTLVSQDCRPRWEVWALNSYKESFK